jgi:hypothetical protein
LTGATWTLALAVAAGLGTVALVGCQPPPTLAPGRSDAAPLDGDAPEADVTMNVDAGFDAAEAPRVADAAGAEGPPGSTILHVQVHDVATGKPLPAKIFLRQADTGQQLHFGDFADKPLCEGMAAGTLREVGSGGALATWNGIALWNGDAELPVGAPWQVPGNGCSGDAGVPAHPESIPFGRYLVTAARGLEYEMATASVDLGPGRGEVLIDLPLARTVDTRGYLAADMHIHSGSPDGSGSWDSLVTPANRVKTEAVAGIEVVVSSDHDYLTDLGAPIASLWPTAPPLASIIGDEASASFGHFNAIPMAIDVRRPGNGAPSPQQIQLLTPKQLFDRLHGLQTAPLVQVNHPRLPFAAYFNDQHACNWHDRSMLPRCSLDFDAIEVLNGWLACAGKVHETLDDWYALMAFGVTLTATGNSDTHGSSNIEAGYPRSYVRVDDDSVAGFDEGQFIDALRGHRVIASTGPFLTLRVGTAREGDMVVPAKVPGGTGRQVSVSLRLQSASWIKVDVVRLLVDGHVTKTWNVPVQNGSSAPLFQIENEPVTVDGDAAITAEAEGATPLPTWMVGEFLLQKGLVDLCGNPAQPGMIPFAVTNPVFVDADGDGVFRAGTSAARAEAVHDTWVPPPVGPNDCNPLSVLRPPAPPQKR